jgi:hypothetical protein
VKLTSTQKESIKSNLFEQIKNSETRSKIISTAIGYADETGKDDDLELMVMFLMDKENADMVEDLYQQYGTRTPSDAQESDDEKK